MSLSPDLISNCEDTLNRIATELVLANAGSDDGLVPTYALINELSGATDQQDESLHQACIYMRQALDELLDNSSPFDGRTLEYVNEFVTWAQDGLLKLRSGNDVPPFTPAPWVHDDSSEGSGFKQGVYEDLVNRIATEMVLASSGSDEGLVPIYSLTSQLADISGERHEVAAAAQNMKAALDVLLDSAQPFDGPTMDYLGEFVAWCQDVLHRVRDGEPVTDTFPPMTGLDAVEVSTVTAEEAVTMAFMQKDRIAVADEAADTDAQAALLARISKDADVLLEISDEDKELLGEFQTEALEHLENIEAAVLVLENSPRDGDSLALIFRAFHTIKGVAGFLHMVPIQLLAHDVESLLDHARNHKLTLNSSMITLILQAKDTIQALVDQITRALQSGEMPTEIVPVSHLIVAVQMAAQEGLDIAAGRTPAANSPMMPPVRREPAKAAPPPPVVAATPVAPVVEEEEDEEEPVAAVRKQASTVPQGEGAAAATTRVRTTKLDNLMDMVGELVIVQSQLSESGKTGRMGEGEENAALQRNIAQLQRITRELQHTSMALRLVPIKPTFQKVGRLVRDLAGSFNKKVSFITEGEDTELDRNVVEQINDPLVHMIRNSLDHGLEANEDRVAAGKPSVGTINLKAYHQGSSIVIELRDDGRGIDPAKILKKARERGLVREDQNPARADILNLIFEPGFSTAEKVTDVSGRGVGMDVVRRNIEKLRGKVELDSEVGKGTSFKIKLPLTTAIIDGLVVRVGEDRFILPTTSVKVAIRPEQKQISKIKGKAEVLDLRGKTIPLMRLHERFGIDTEVKNPWDGIVVIIETFGKPYGLLVDDMLSKQEVVIKSLGTMMKGIPGVAGGAILGDGTIALILDPGGLIGIS